MQPGEAERTYSKHRVEALSDGIFAIAMTLLVLNLKPPTDFAPGHIWRAVQLEWPLWLSFALTFGLAARFWALQHEVLDVIEHIGRRALILTFIFLGLISVLPFTTSLLSDHFSDHSVLTLYFAHELAIAIMLVFILEVCRAHGHTLEGASLRSVRIKIYGMSATLASCIVLASFVKPYWVAVPPPVIGFLERRLQSRRLPFQKQTRLR
jgi:uncharacterized membrane protein